MFLKLTSVGNSSFADLTFTLSCHSIKCGDAARRRNNSRCQASRRGLEYFDTSRVDLDAKRSSTSFIYACAYVAQEPHLYLRGTSSAQIYQRIPSLPNTLEG